MTDLRLDRYTRGLLTVIAGLLFVLAIELWAMAPPMLSDARAQIPDSGEQRLKMLQQQQETNRLLKQIVTIMQSEPIKVTVVGTDKTQGPTGPTVIPAPKKQKAP